ncbi:DUF11 domain-containing protein [Parapedobacter soli]|uniref:DUF11 domain-containing protein n=1 Tax=Parapedobacter soli TaxID=416955 RepID=UPI0021C5A317|nr:DUF11 domain-containing protein [Parapedobacter soli]
MRQLKTLLMLFVLTFAGGTAIAQTCSINAGGDVTICGTTHTLAGAYSGNTSGSPTWTIVSKPAGAPDPEISDINSYTPDVTGLTHPGDYTFQISQNCTSGTVTSQVTVTAPGDVSTFTAGADITTTPASVGEVELNAVVPPGYTIQWSAINIYNNVRFSQTNSANAQFSTLTSPTTTFSLIKKANHDVDPAYRVIAKITSIENPNCSYEDELIVRFIPNPQIELRSPYSMCISPTNPAGDYYLPFTANSPIFATRQSDVAGNPAYGTTVTLNVVSQPAGGNISYRDISDERLYFDGTDVPGSYVFTITVSNTLGESYTTPNLTYTNNGIQPRNVSFLTASRPEQMAVYSFGGSGGEVHCASMAGTNTPITFFFTIDPSDPATVISIIKNSGIAPPGGAPTLSLSGAGTHDRSVTVTPPAGGWSVGTYRIGVETRNGTGPGSCGTSQDYFIHISDGNRVDVGVDDITVCYPGSGSVTATVPLPDVYQQVVNSSYLQNFDGIYHFTTVSRPPGSAVPVFQTTDQRTLTHTSTTISNLNREGEYVFTIEARPRAGGVGAFLDQEYECSDASLKGTFSVFVSTQVNANAGSDQNITCPLGATITMNGNDPGVASNGEWTIESKPVGAPDPTFSDITLRNAEVSGFRPGTYTLRWTITTGDCTSYDETTLTVTDTDCPAPGGVAAAAWHRADALVYVDNGTTLASEGQKIQFWGEFNGTGMDFSQTTEVRKPTYTPEVMLNFNPTVRFTRADLNHMIYTAPTSSVKEMGSLYFVAKQATATNFGSGVLGWDNTMDYPGWHTLSSGEYLLFHNGNFTPTTEAINSSIPNIIGGSWKNGAGINTSRLLFDTRYNGFVVSYDNVLNISHSNTVYRIGHDTNYGAYDGNIGEALYFAHDLTADEKNRVDSYLAIKYGVTLRSGDFETGVYDYRSSDNSVVWDGTTNTAYHNNVFGIANDENSALDQKQSRSQNPSQKLIIGAGNSLAESNAENSNSLTDGQFLMIGDNGLEQGLRVPLAYTGGTNGETNMRFASIWKTQNTGSVGTVTIAWPKGVRNLYLVQSSDDVIDLSDDFVPMTNEVTINGVVYNIANVTLGNYFTFAGFGNAPGGVTNGLSYWYRADMDVENTGEDTDVTGWTDMWGGTTVAQLGDNRLPTYKQGAVDYFNFNPGINFTDLTQRIGNIEVRTLTNDDYDIFTFTKEGVSGNRLLNIGYSNTRAAGGNWDQPGIRIDGRVGFRNTNEVVVYSDRYPGGIQPSTTIPSIMYRTFTQTTVSQGLNGDANGVDDTFATPIGSIEGGHIFGDNRAAPLGGDDAGMTGHVGETIIYGAGTLSDIERRRVDSYLAIKYGITLGRVATEHYLSADESLVWNGSANTAFNNNIFGVAREDIGLFEQKVSNSVNAGTILTIATNDDFVSPNLEASRTGFANDQTYFLLGDNDVVDTDSEIMVIGGENYKRIKRTWLSQRHNTPGELFFQADLLSYGSDFSALNGVVMIIADDEDFTVNVRTIQGVHQVGKWIHSYDFNADASQQYITYGVMEEECLPEFVWSSPVVASGNTATGTIGGIGYTYTSSSNVLTSPQIFDSYNVFPASTDPSDIFSFPRLGHAVIRNIEVTSNTITFDAPVTDPILVFSSIGGPAGAVPVEFAQPMEVLWMDSPPGSWSVSWDSEYQITGHEGYAIVRIPGTHSSISFDYTAAENYANFMFGVAKERNCAVDIQVHKIGPVSAEVGGTISYTIHVTNNGPGDATDVVVKDPEVDYFEVTGVTYELGAGSGGSATAPASATIADLQGAGIVIPSMPSSSGVTFTVTGTVTGVVNDIIVNTATAEYEDDTDLSNNSATVSTEIYGCVGEESTYTFSATATAALPTNVFGPDGGTIDLVYTLASGDPVPGIGTEFTVPVTISEFRSHFGEDHKWLDYRLEAGGTVLTLRPDVGPNGINGWYDGLPPNNQQAEGPPLAHNRTDNVFTTRLEEGAIDELGRFSMTIGNYPVAPAGYTVKTEAFEVTAAGDLEINFNRSGFWMKPLIQTGINPVPNANILSTKLRAGDTYEWRYAAFSDGTDYRLGEDEARGVGFRALNSVTFFKDCQRRIITNPILINQARQ